jgi:hypothetical protein
LRFDQFLRAFLNSTSGEVDVFGAGAVLYFALSNTLPFPGKSLKKVLELTAKCKVRYDPTLFGESWVHNMNVNPKFS